MMNKRVRGFVWISAVVMMVIMAIFIQEKVNVKRKVIKQIISMQKGEGELDTKLLQHVSKEIEDTNIGANDAFIVGYAKYQVGDAEVAKEYLYKAYLSKNETIKLYASVVLSEILLSQEANTEVVELVGETLATLSISTYNREIQTLTELMKNILYIENGKQTMITSLEKVLENSYLLNEEVVCDLKNKVGVLYFYNGNYARGIEKFLEVMAHSETMENKYYGAKAQVDLGVIYNILGNYEEAKRNFKEALEIEISDIEDRAFIKTYASINLYENILYEKDYDNVREIKDDVLEHIKYLPDELYESIVIMNEIFLCKYYIQLGEIEHAESILQALEKNLKAFSTYEYLSVHTNYFLVKAELAKAKGNSEEAINLYKELLEDGDMQFKKYILKHIIEVLNQCGYYKEANEYEVELRNYYEQEAMNVNMDYSDYALYKYEHEKALMEETRIKVKKYIYRIILLIITLGVIGIFYLKNQKLIQLNKLDGLVKIYNRRYFETYYKELQSGETPFAIIIFDIDYFKSINDVHGHLVGDQVIKKVVELSKLVIGEKGKLFRYGGEEFVGIIEETSIEEVLQIAECIRKNIEAYNWQEEMNITVSVGVAQTTHEIRDILNQADQNLYTAKTQGRNQVIYKII